MGGYAARMLRYRSASRRLLKCIGLFAGLMSLYAAAVAPPLPSGGVLVFPRSETDILRLDGLPPGSLKRVEVAGQAFTSALEVDVPRQGANPWEFRLGSLLHTGARKGDIVHLRFWARNVYSMTGAARLAVVVEAREHSMNKIVDLAITVGSGWECVDVPMELPGDLAAGEWEFSIRLAYAAQRVQIADPRLLNFQRTVRIEQLPKIKGSYAGREPGAPWRAAAQARVETLRKGDLRVLVKDGGNPAPNVEVRATLRRHEFAFGTCVSMALLAQTPDGDRYRETLKQLFNWVVIENDLKWHRIVRNGYQNPDALIDWLERNRFSIRGHCLVWPGEKNLPREAVALVDQPERLRKLIAEHITTTVQRYRGRLAEWDVINEPYSNHLLMDKLGDEAMVDWFRVAQQADPGCRLFINDYEILASGDLLGTPHQNHYYSRIKYLKDQGAPVRGIGMQGHFGSNITSPENLLKILDRFAEFGLRIKVTEMDLLLSDEALRADYYRDFFLALFSHPAVDGVFQWGFWEGSHWIPGAALFRKDWTLRPHGQVYRDLMQRDWHTEVSVRTDEKGLAVFRGFKGEYEVQVTLREKRLTVPGIISANAGEMTVELPPDQ